MKEVLEFLEKAGVYYLATSKDNKPYVRPFGTINLFENKLYIQTGKSKTCYKEMIDNPNVEISAFNDGKWIRVSAKVVADDRVIAKKAMLDKYPDLRRMYDENDSNTIVLYLTEVVATIYSFTEASKTFKF
ncbi:MAG: pyridoxamine 5'-phosphate oxidase family protein [bacterium]|nr:pyridoxamine 5'-phosphate oxidase family protein [bacterium]